MISASFFYNLPIKGDQNSDTQHDDKCPMIHCGKPLSSSVHAYICGICDDRAKVNVRETLMTSVASVVCCYLDTLKHTYTTQTLLMATVTISC